MKKFLSILLISIMIIGLSACGSTKVINGVEYDTYGIFNEANKKNPEIKYRTIIGNIVWSCILVETIIAPVYFLGFSLFEPVGKANPFAPKGAL